MDIKEKIIEFVKNIPEIEIVILYEEEDNILIYLNKEIDIKEYDKIYSFMGNMDILCYASTRFLYKEYNSNKYEDSITHEREHNVLEIIYDKESII